MKKTEHLAAKLNALIVYASSHPIFFITIIGWINASKLFISSLESRLKASIGFLDKALLDFVQKIAEFETAPQGSFPNLDPSVRDTA